MKKHCYGTLALIALLVLTASAKAWQVGTPAFREKPMLTEWGAKVTPENAWREHPRPQFRRDSWRSLDGLWNYRVADVADGIPERFDGEILVPFPAGSELSGVVQYPGHTNALWYSRTVELSPKAGERTILHIDGSDFRTQVFVNGLEATDCPHETAQLALDCDITRFLRSGSNRIDIQVWDPMGSSALTGNSSGKQSLHYDGCFYTPIYGIWAPVWLETVPDTHIVSYRVTPDFDAGAVDVLVKGVGDVKGARCMVKVLKDGRQLACGEVAAWGRALRLKLPTPVAAWSPESPALYDLEIALGNDLVKGYFGMRKFEVKKDPKGVLRFYLNNQLYFPIGTLDQGWWPDGLLTPPSDEAMAFDILTLKKMGFNMMRKHIKVEPMRYYYLCDKLGILVLQDMPSGGGDINGRYGRYRAELKGMIDQLYNTPSIVMWIAYNERWGQPKAAQTSWTLKWVKRYDPSRVCDGPSGWSDYEGGYWKSLDGKGKLTPTEHLPEGVLESADVIDFHAYPGPRMLPVNTHRATFIGEFGGLGCRLSDEHLWNPKMRNWGYRQADDRAKLMSDYLALMDALQSLAFEGLAGSVYTQTTDVEGEINGLVSYDRRVIKYDTAALKAAHEKVIKAARDGAVKTRVTENLSPRCGEWAYCFDAAPAGWERPDFDAASWKRGKAGFGSVANPRIPAVVNTPWKTKTLFLRRTFDLPSGAAGGQPVITMLHDEDVQIYLNGELVLERSGYVQSYQRFSVDNEKFARLAKKTGNVLAVKVVQTYGDQFFDMDFELETLK